MVELAQGVWPVDRQVLLVSAIALYDDYPGAVTPPLSLGTGILRNYAALFQPAAATTSPENNSYLTATLFRDVGSATCGTTSLTPATLPNNTCTLTFKVVGGGILGASSPSPSCPANTFLVQQPGGKASCVPCYPGRAPPP